MYPRVAGRLPAWQLATVLATSRLVGMECPGLHSVFLGFELEFAAAPPAGTETLRYRVDRYDPRFCFLAMAIAAPGLHGEVRALLRARPVAQPALAALAPLVPANAFVGRRALVVGGSRGLGETCAKLLAAGGGEVVLTYARGAADAGRVAAEIAAAGGVAHCLALDVTAIPPGWREALGDWRPTDLLYFATPRIARRRGGGFDEDQHRRYRAYYVDGFRDLFYEVSHRDLRRVLYPSSVYVAERPGGFEEYAAAKQAGEALCGGLARRHPAVEFHAPRLPRLATDQTAADAPVAAPVLLARLLEDAAAHPAAARTGMRVDAG